MNPDTSEPGGIQAVLRPHLWRRSELLGWTAFILCSIVTGWREPDPGPLWAGLVVVASLAAARWPGRLWLAIADGDVSCSPRLALGRRSDVLRAARARIRAVEAWSNQVILSGENGETVLSLRPCWTQAQLGELAMHLGVPLIRHRGRKGR